MKENNEIQRKKKQNQLLLMFVKTILQKQLLHLQTILSQFVLKLSFTPSLGLLLHQFKNLQLHQRRRLQTASHVAKTNVVLMQTLLVLLTGDKI